MEIVVAGGRADCPRTWSLMFGELQGSLGAGGGWVTVTSFIGEATAEMVETIGSLLGGGGVPAACIGLEGIAPVGDKTPRNVAPLTSLLFSILFDRKPFLEKHS